MKFTLASIVAVASLSAVNAQTPNISACVLQCVTQAASSAGCSSITDTTCVCTSADFQNAALTCLTSTCTTEEQQSAVQLQQQLCAGQSASGSLSTTISAPSASSSLDGGALSSLSSSVAMTSMASSTASASGATASAGSVASVASSGIADGASSASSLVSVAASGAGGVLSSAASVLPNAAMQLPTIHWGVVGGGALGLAIGAMAVL